MRAATVVQVLQDLFYVLLQPLVVAAVILNFKFYCKFLPYDAMRCTVSVIVILSVCPSVRPSVCLSVCHTRGLCPHGSTYDHDFFATG